MPPETLFAQWREAHRLANQAERELFEAALKYADGTGPKPADAQVAEADALRRNAKELFKDALRSVDEQVAAARRGLYTPSRSNGAGSSHKQAE